MIHLRLHRLLATGCSVVIGAVSLGTWVAAAEPATAPSRVLDERVVQWVRYCTAQRLPTAQERRFDQVGWACDVLEAQQLAREHRRPVFLFSHEGRMNLGHC